MDLTTIVVVDDHPLFRQGVVDTLSLEPGFEVIGQSADGDEGFKMIHALRPNVAVVDIKLAWDEWPANHTPGCSGKTTYKDNPAHRL